MNYINDGAHRNTRFRIYADGVPVNAGGTSVLSFNGDTVTADAFRRMSGEAVRARYDAFYDWIWTQYTGPHPDLKRQLDAQRDGLEATGYGLTACPLPADPEVSAEWTSAEVCAVDSSSVFSWEADKVCAVDSSSVFSWEADKVCAVN